MLHQLWSKKSTITVTGKSIGKVLFASTTHGPEHIVLKVGPYNRLCGEVNVKHEREESYGHSY